MGAASVTFHDRHEAHKMLEALCGDPIRADLILLTLERAVAGICVIASSEQFRAGATAVYADASVFFCVNTASEYAWVRWNARVTAADEASNLEYTLEKLED